MFNRGARRPAHPDPRKGTRAACPAAAEMARSAEPEAALLRQIDNALELLVSGSLRQADEAAQRGDYGEALAWLQTVDSVALPSSYEAKRADWMHSRSTL